MKCSFPEVVWAHHLREHELHSGHSSPYAGQADERYRAFRAQFESQHGRIVDEYWCSDEASAVVVCMKEAHRPLRWLGKDPSARIYSETNWKTRDLPVPVAELVHEADALAMHAREVLRSTAQRLVIQRLFGVMAYLLGTFDGREMTEKACKPVIDSAVEGGRRDPPGVRDRGDPVGADRLFLGDGQRARLARDSRPARAAACSTRRRSARGLKALYGCAVAGALGAMVSVVARMNQASFKVEYDVGRPTVRRLGAFRPLVGAVFGDRDLPRAREPPDAHRHRRRRISSSRSSPCGRSSRGSASGSFATRWTASRRQLAVRARIAEPPRPPPPAAA